MMASSEVDLQAVANELSTNAKIWDSDFNKLLTTRIPFIIANLDRANVQEIVVILSSMGIRISRQLLGSKFMSRHPRT